MKFRNIREYRPMIRAVICIFSVLLVVSACGSTHDGQGDSPLTVGVGSKTSMLPQGVETASSQVIPGSQEDLVLNVGDKIFFKYDSSVLTPEAQNILTAQARWLNRYPHSTITVEGHCDERGTREYNLALGDRRAASARHYLISSGVSSDRVSIISYGKERPELIGSNEGIWAQNRRGVIVIN